MHVDALRRTIREMAAAAQGQPPRAVYQNALPVALARLYLRRSTQLGMFTRVFGKPRVINHGTLRIGERVLIWSNTVPTELVVFTGAVLEIGDRTQINYGTSIAATGSIRIGRKCLLGTYTMILDNDFHELERREIRPEPRPVVLEDNVWLGNRTLILPGVTIGHDAVIGAGSVVMTSIPPRSLAMGNPARVVRTF